MRKKTAPFTDVIIVGAGPAGLSLSLALADAGISCLLIDRFLPWAQKGPRDNRTAALLRPSVEILDGVGVRAETLDGTAPLSHLRLIDIPAGQSDLPTPITFSAHEINEPYFALNIRHTPLVDALAARVTTHPLITIMAPVQIISLNVNQAAATIITDHGKYQASLIIGADGKQSRVRDLAGIGATQTDYHQTALTTEVAIIKPHHDTSIEFHRPGGPFTLVPMTGARASVVWLEKHQQADDILALPANQQNKRLNAESHGVLGQLTMQHPLQAWPITWTRAAALIAPRIALVAEAAHALPPSGAQGLNLSLQDIVALTRTLARAKRCGLDLGSAAVLGDYARERTGAINWRSRAVDGLNRLIMTETVPLRHARRLGLKIAGNGILRHQLMRLGWMGG